MDATEKLNALLAKPTTHEVVVAYDNGDERIVPMKSAQSAANFAAAESARIGLELTNHETGDKLTIVSVEVRSVQ
jgi:hypothetical protein